MSLDLQVLLLIILFAAPSAFVAYWAGVGVTERRLQARIDNLVADADFATEMWLANGTDRVADVAHRSHLRLVGGDA